MTTRPTRSTVAGRAYLDLQNLARRTGRLTDELHQMYALEGFLDRLAASPHARHLVLKGGVLLAAYDARRPTRDIDLQGRWISNDVDKVRQMVCEIAGRHADDGLTFDVDRAVAGTIRDEGVYNGVRVNLTGRLSAARLHLHVDVNVGDPIWPSPTMVDVPRLLDGTVRVIGYPLPMVYAEKLVTVIERGTANTRWRDFADIYLLSRRHDVDGSALSRAVNEVAAYRGVPVMPQVDALDGFAASAQPRWSAWRRKSKLEDRLPWDFGAVLSRLSAFADPVAAGTVGDHIWVATDGTWRRRGGTDVP